MTTPQNWWIKVAPRATPNADGEWRPCGEHSFEHSPMFWECVRAFGHIVPKGWEIVAVSSRDPAATKNS